MYDEGVERRKPEPEMQMPQATLIYRIVRIDTVTGTRRVTGSTVEVAGKRFSARTDAEARDVAGTHFIDVVTGHVCHYEAERLDAAALESLENTMREAEALLASMGK
jgi:Ni2+-binding GTPase involved in maturation of urease and hydrogenase